MNRRADERPTATLFCRVSSTRQASNYSHETQERLGREYAERKGYRITRVFRVVETASKKDERRLWGEYLEHMRNGPEPHALIATVDRALRNFWDLPEISELRKRHGKTVHFFLEGLVLDGTNASSDELRLGMSAAVATYYATQLGEKTRRGMDAKARTGKWPNRAPFGYKHSGGQIVTDPDRARFAVRIKQLSATGRYSLKQIARTIAAEGCRLWGEAMHPSQVERVIRNPFHAGRYEWPKDSGNWIRGVHEPLVSWDLHERAVAGLERLHKPRYRKHEHLYVGKMSCGDCGSRTIVFGQAKGKYTYGYCIGARYITVDGVRVKACPKAQYVRLETIEEQVVAALETISLDQERAEALLAKITRDAGAEQGRVEAQLALIKGQLTKLEQKMARAYEDKLDGKIDEAFWQKQQREWALKKVELEESLRRGALAGPAAFMPQIRQVFELAKSVVPQYKSATDAEKRELLDLVFLNLRLTGKKVEAEMKKPFDAIAEGHHSGVWWPVCDAIRTWAASQTGPFAAV
jgi:site-specific DNA recombinase